MSQSSHDRNLLLGVLALQMDFVSRDQLVAALNAWVLQKHRALGDVLKEQASLSDEEHALLAGLVERRIKRNAGDVHASLTGVVPSSDVRNLLTLIRDDGVAATLAAAAGANGHPPADAPLSKDGTAGKSTAAPASIVGDGAPRYEALKPHARGGLGQVWLARDKQLYREVALKELLAYHADNTASRARFMQEAEITGRLEHPGIVPIYSLGVHQDGRPYYAMRFIHGENFKDAIRRFHGLQPDSAEPTKRGRSWVDLDQHGAVEPKAPTPHAGAGTAEQRASAAGVESAGFDLGLTLVAERTLEEDAAEATPPRRKLRYQSLEFRKLLERFLDVCNAVEYAHSRGVVHRDLKPSNIMLGKYGETLVVDWGLAKAVGRDEQHEHSAEATLIPSSGSDSGGTQMGTAIGTPAYMSPEQAAGDLDRAGPASDVYSLGATLYELLTGQGPFSGSDVKTVLERVIRGDFPRPRDLKKAVPPALEAVCLKAMALKPQDRYASADTLAEDLRHWMADEPVTSHAETWPQRVGRWMRRHKTWVKAGVAMLCLWIVIASSAAVRINASRQEAEDDKEKAQQLAGRLEQSLYYTRVATADKELAAKNAGQAADLLESCAPELRAVEWKLLKRRLEIFDRSGAIEPPHMLVGHTRAVSEIAFSPREGLIASGSVDGTVRVWDLASGRERFAGRHFYPIIFPVSALAFSPDSRTLASGAATFNVDAIDWDVLARRLQSPDADLARVLGKSGMKEIGGLLRGEVWDAMASLFGTSEGRDLLANVTKGDTPEILSEMIGGTGRDLLPEGVRGEIRIWDAQTGEVRRVLTGHTSQIAGLSYSPDGRRLISVSKGSTDHQSELIVWDADTGQRLDYVSNREQLFSCVAVDPQGEIAALGVADGTIVLRDLGAKADVRTIAAHSGPVVKLAFSRHREMLASTSMDGTIRLWDPATGKALLPPLRGHVGPVFGVCFHPGEDRLVTSGWDKTVRIWDTTTGRETLNLTGHTDSVLCAQFSPQGDAIASGGGGTDTAIRLWSAAPAEENIESEPTRTLRWHAAAVSSVGFSGDGKHLAASGMDQKVVVAGAEDFQERFALKAPDDHQQIVSDVAFSPVGNVLATASWDKTAKLWDVASGKLLRAFESHIGPVNCVQFSPNGGLLATGSGTGAVKLQDVQTGEERVQLAGHNFAVNGVAFSPDGARLASCGYDNLVKVWDVDSGRHLFSLIGHEDIVWQVAFSADGKFIVTVSNDRTARVWNASTGALVRVMKGHHDHIWALTVHPDPRHSHVVATGSEDGMVILWDLRNGRETAPRLQMAGVIRSLAFDATGKRLAAGGGYPHRGEVRVWEVQMK